MSETIKRVLIILSASVLFGLSWPAARGAYLDGANNVFVISVFGILGSMAQLLGGLKDIKIYGFQRATGLTV